jgi:hypothetical protein
VRRIRNGSKEKNVALFLATIPKTAEAKTALVASLKTAPIANRHGRKQRTVVNLGNQFPNLEIDEKTTSF